MTTKEAVEIAKEKVGWINVQINYHKKILEFNPKNLKSHNDFIYYTELKEALSHLISIAERAMDRFKIYEVISHNQQGLNGSEINKIAVAIVNYLEGR